MRPMEPAALQRVGIRRGVLMMQVRKKKTTKPRAALKKPALKARTAKSKRGAPEKEQRKRADAANHTSKSSRSSARCDESWGGAHCNRTARAQGSRVSGSVARSCDDANVAGASEVHSHVTTGETRAYWQYKVVSIGRVNPQLAAALAQARAKCCVLGNIHARPPVARCRIWPDGPACPVHCRRTRALRRSVHAAPLRCFGRKARRLISELTRAALAIRKANSGRLGNPANKACFAVRQSNSTQNESHSGRSDMMPPARCQLLMRLCCKSRFARVMKSSAGRRRGFRVKM